MNFNDNLREVFEIIKNNDTRILNQYITVNNISLINYYYQRYTPLMEAAYLSRADMVEFILHNVKNKYSNHDIVSKKYKDYVNFKSTDGKTALFLSTLNNKETDIVKILLTEGADTKIQDSAGKTVFDYKDLALSNDMEHFWDFLGKTL